MSQTVLPTVPPNQILVIYRHTPSGTPNKGWDGEGTWSRWIMKVYGTTNGALRLIEQLRRTSREPARQHVFYEILWSLESECKDKLWKTVRVKAGQYVNAAGEPEPAG